MTVLVQEDRKRVVQQILTILPCTLGFWEVAFPPPPPQKLWDRTNFQRAVILPHSQTKLRRMFAF